MADRTAVPAELSSERPTEKQAGFIRGLIAERDLSKLTDKQQKWLADEYAKPMEVQFTGVSVKRASDIITQLLALPVRTDIVQKQNSGLPDVPAGRYAVESDEGELRFYRLWIGKTGYKKLYVLHGPDSTEIPYKAALGVLGKIFRAGVVECAQRYGREIGSCSNCGRRLTNRISRELGIGPVCGGRMFGDRFMDKVDDATQAIRARGEDPDEEL